MQIKMVIYNLDHRVVAFFLVDHVLPRVNDALHEHYVSLVLILFNSCTADIIKLIVGKAAGWMNSAIHFG